MRRSVTLWFLAFVLVSLVGLPAAAGEGVLGKWEAAIENQRGTNEVVMEFKGSDEELQGTWTDRRGAADLDDVKYADGRLSFKRAVEFQGNSFTLGYAATIDGDTMNVTMTTPQGEREFTAKRAK